MHRVFCVGCFFYCIQDDERWWLFASGSTYSLENESSQQGLESELQPSSQPLAAQQQQQSLAAKPTALPSLAYDSGSDEFYQQTSSHQPFVNNAEGSSNVSSMQNSFQDGSGISYDDYYHPIQSSDNLHGGHHFYKEEDYSYCYYNNNYNYEYNGGEYSSGYNDIVSADTYNGYFCSQHHGTCTTTATQHAQSCDVTYAQY